MPCWVSPPRPLSQRSLLAGTPASRRSRGARPTRRCWPHTPRTHAALSASETAASTELAALQLSGSGVVNAPAWAGFATWELLRATNVVRNLHFMAPLSAALANGDDSAAFGLSQKCLHTFRNFSFFRSSIVRFGLFRNSSFFLQMIDVTCAALSCVRFGPKELLPVKVQYCKELKKSMKELCEMQAGFASPGRERPEMRGGACALEVVMRQRVTTLRRQEMDTGSFQSMPCSWSRCHYSRQQFSAHEHARSCRLGRAAALKAAARRVESQKRQQMVAAAKALTALCDAWSAAASHGHARDRCF